MIETAVRSILTGDGDVAALIAARVYPVVLPQTPVYPAASFQLISGASDYTMAAPSGLASARVQVDCWAESYAAVMALRRAVIMSLGGYRGTSAGVAIHGVFKVSERDGFENELAATGARVWRKSLDFNIWFKEV